MNKYKKHIRILIHLVGYLSIFFIIYYLLFGFYMPIYSNPLMNGRVDEVRALNISPHQWYYEPNPSAKDMTELFRVGNFPYRTPPATLVEAENINVFYDVIPIVAFQVGDNYQLSRHRTRQFSRTYVLLNDEQRAFFMPLDNGIHFVVIEESGLRRLSGVEEAVKERAYLRVTKAFGRVTLVDKRVLLSYGETWSNYWPNGNHRELEVRRYNLKGDITETIYSIYRQEDGGLEWETVKQPNYRRSTQRIEEVQGYTMISDIYVNDIRTRHIEAYVLDNEETITNQLLDSDGKVISVTNHDERDPVLYFDEPPIYQTLARDEARYQKIKHLQQNPVLMKSFVQSGSVL